MNVELNPKTTSVPPNSTIIPIKHRCNPEHLCELLWFKLSNFPSAKFKEIFLYKASSLGKFTTGILIQRGILFLSYHWKHDTKFSSQLHNWKFTEPEQQQGCNPEYSHPRSSMLFPVSKPWFKWRDPAPFSKHYTVTLLLVPSHVPKHQVQPFLEHPQGQWLQEQTSPGRASWHRDRTVPQTLSSSLQIEFFYQEEMHVPVTYS